MNGNDGFGKSLFLNEGPVPTIQTPVTSIGCPATGSLIILLIGLAGMLIDLKNKE